MIELNIYKAQPTGDYEAISVSITINEPLPDLIAGNPPESEWRPIVTEKFEREAGELERALYNSLPGGTYDALFGLIAKRKASVFCVSHAS